MEFSLTAEQQTLVDSARQYAREALAPGYQEREKAGRIEEEVRLEMGAKGFIAPEISKELGGQGVSRLTSGMLLEQISTGDFNVGYLQVVGSLVGQILAAATPGPRSPRTGYRRSPAARASSGSACPNRTPAPTRATPACEPSGTASDWVLTGAKSHVPARPRQRRGRLRPHQRRGPRPRHHRVRRRPRTSPGSPRSRTPTWAPRRSRRGAAHFDHVRVPAENVLGEEGQGFTQVMQGFDFSRALIGLQCIGTAQQTVDETWEYVSQREAFDRPISKNQGVVVPARRGRNPAHRSTFAVLPDAVAQGRRPAAHRRGGHVQVVGTRRPSYDVINTCLLLHGQYGYRTEKPIEQRLRDVLGLQIGDGTAQIMKLIISRQKLGRALAP